MLAFVHIHIQKKCVCVCVRLPYPLSAHRVGDRRGLSEMQAQAYLIWIMYKTLIEAVCSHQSGEQEVEGGGTSGGTRELVG